MTTDRYEQRGTACARTRAPSTAVRSGRQVRPGVRTRLAVRAGVAVSSLSRRLGLGAGGVIGGRVALALDPRALDRLAPGHRTVLVSGTNGKTTTAHMVAAGLATTGEVAHNSGGANMADGVLTALMRRPRARWAVLEVDELHLGRVADAVSPAVVLLLNLTRDQLDRGTEVRAVAHSLAAALERHPETLVVANADDPLVVGAVPPDARVIWVAAGAGWLADAAACPRCAGPLAAQDGAWACGCGLVRPPPTWILDDGTARGPGGTFHLPLRLPGRFNRGNATFALAACTALGIRCEEAVPAIARLDSVAGRYAVVRRGRHAIHLLLAKNPAGWSETLPLLAEAAALLLVVNAHEADGRDTSWLWDVPFEGLPGVPTVASGERAADLGLRLSYADREHRTEPDPLAALELLPPGPVYAVANYTAFLRLSTGLGAGSPP